YFFDDVTIDLFRSERIIGPIHNSGLAEILAAQMALRSLRKWKGYKNEPVILRTDFLPLVRAYEWWHKFAEEMETVRSLAMEYPNGVQFEHVYAHDGDPGNEQMRDERDPQVPHDMVDGAGTTGNEGVGQEVANDDPDQESARATGIDIAPNPVTTIANTYEVIAHSLRADGTE
ncbi:hypothetical protein OSTOST_11701, partial [Ostertagia ostertagi]